MDVEELSSGDCFCCLFGGSETAAVSLSGGGTMTTEGDSKRLTR